MLMTVSFHFFLVFSPFRAFVIQIIKSSLPGANCTNGAVEEVVEGVPAHEIVVEIDETRLTRRMFVYTPAPSMFLVEHGINI